LTIGKFVAMAVGVGVFVAVGVAVASTSARAARAGAIGCKNPQASKTTASMTHAMATERRKLESVDNLCMVAS
jgi:hypothetical protein